MRSADCSGIPNRVSVGTRPHVILKFFSSQDYNIENQARTPGPLYPDLTDPFRVSCSCGVLAADRTRRDAASTPSGLYRGLGQSPGGNYALLHTPYSPNRAGDRKGVPARRGLLGSTPGPITNPPCAAIVFMSDFHPAACVKCARERDEKRGLAEHAISIHDTTVLHDGGCRQLDLLHPPGFIRSRFGPDLDNPLDLGARRVRDSIRLVPCWRNRMARVLQRTPVPHAHRQGAHLACIGNRNHGPGTLDSYGKMGFRRVCRGLCRVDCIDHDDLCRRTACRNLGGEERPGVQVGTARG